MTRTAAVATPAAPPAPARPDPVEQSLPIALLRDSATNPRKTFEPAALEELAATIRQHGVREPLIVRTLPQPPDVHGFGSKAADDDVDAIIEIVSGHRRKRAALAAGLTHVPCRVHEGMSDAEAAEIAIISNLQRADVHPMEEAEAYSAMIEQSQGWRKIDSPRGSEIVTPLTPEDVARRVGKSLSYVSQRLKLVDLIAPARDLFAALHISLGHALHLAKLMPADQEKACVYLIGNPMYTKPNPKESIADFVARKIKHHAENEDEHRLCPQTEAELKKWIAENVLLQLGKAPWNLAGTMEMNPQPGPCTTCPKRSGSNAALFGDLTADADVCLDRVCFGAKHKAFIQNTQEIAKEQGAPLLRLSTKRGGKKLPEPLGEKVVIRSGQWVAAKHKSCPAARKGIFIDTSTNYAWGEKRTAGEILTVCIDQKCKVHEHTVEGESSTSSRPNDSGLNGMTDAQRAEREAKVKAYREREWAARLSVVRAAVDLATKKPEGALRRIAAAKLDEMYDVPDVSVAGLLGVPFAQAGPADNLDGRAEVAIRKHLSTAGEAALLRALVVFDLVEDLQPGSPDYCNNERTQFARAAKEAYGIDLGPLFKQADAAAPKAEPEKKAAKPAAKKSTPAKAAKKPVAKKVLTPAKRKAIADNMKKRWAAKRKAVSK